MDALHPRLLVGRFADTFRFYDAVLPGLVGAALTRGGESGPYASWDVGAEGVLSLFDRAAMAEVTGGTDLSADPPPARNRAVLVSRVPDVTAGYELCLRHGGRPVAPPADRPEWGPSMRTAHLRDPDGNLLELQSY
ncbi:VOC family protein [Streptomyces sp. NPDC093221]|uniref:VOC family protein n=1 Tax=Streptomyces sp. NPDC093221 TaxID=3366032 RepID=UPI00380438F4